MSVVDVLVVLWVGLFALQRASHRLHRQGECQSDDPRIFLGFDGIDEHRRRGFAHPQIDEHSGDEDRRLR